MPTGHESHTHVDTPSPTFWYVPVLHRHWVMSVFPVPEAVEASGQDVHPVEVASAPVLLYVFEGQF